MFATFEATVNIIDEEYREKISHEIYERRKLDVGDGTTGLNADDSEDEDLIGYDAIEPGLPPASSDRQRWWLENGKMARSAISAPKPVSSSHQAILNPNRPSNPYAPSEEPDWVSVPRSESRLSSFSSMSTSPYEHVNHSTLLSSSASSTTPRKLPPPYDPSSLPARVGRINLNDDIKSVQTDGPPPPPPRRQTAMATTSVPSPSPSTTTQPPGRPVLANARAPQPPPPRPASAASQTPAPKGPPPVAKKPAHLTQPLAGSSAVSEAGSRSSIDGGSKGFKPEKPRRSSTSVPGFRRPSDGFSLDGPPLPARNGTVVRADTASAPPPELPRRFNSVGPSGGGISASGRASPAGAVGLPGLMQRDSGPRVPVRIPAQVDKPALPAPKWPVAQAQTVDLLGDDASNDMGRWEALKPSQ